MIFYWLQVKSVVGSISFVVDVRLKEMQKEQLHGLCSLKPIDCAAAITYVLWNLNKNNPIFYYNNTDTVTNLYFQDGSYDDLLTLLQVPIAPFRKKIEPYRNVCL